MTESFSGGCACGAIRFVCSAEPIVVFNCHCRDCQKATGGAFVSGVAVPKDALNITGQPKFHSVIGESGNTMYRGFCAECGSRVFANTSAANDIIAIHIGSLDNPNRFQPAMDIWTSSALKWDHMNPALPKLPKGLPGR